MPFLSDRFMEDRETAFTVYFFSGLLKYVKGYR